MQNVWNGREEKSWEVILVNKKLWIWDSNYGELEKEDN